MAWKNMPIREKLMAVILLTSAVVLFLTCVSFITYEFITLHKNMLSNYVTRSQIIAANSTASLAFQNPADATEVLASLKSDERLTQACIYDNKGKVFAKYPATQPTADFPAEVGTSGYREGHLEIFSPVVQEGRPLGTVYLQANLSALTDRYRAFLWLSLGIILGSLLVALLLSRMLQKQISMPILALAETAKAISEHRDYSVRAQKFSGDELGLLTDAFNQMLSEISAREQDLKASEANYREIFDKANDGIIVLDPDSASPIVDINDKTVQMTGYGPEEFKNMPIEKLVSGEPGSTLEDFIQWSQMAMTEGSQIFEWRFRHKDGHVFWVEVSLQKTLLAGKTRLIAFLRDISDRKRLEEISRLGESQAIENIRDYAIFLLDREGKVLTWNSGAEAIKGYSRAEILGKSNSIFYTAEDKAKGHPAEVLRAAAENGRYEEEGIRVRKDGSRFEADVIVTALRNEKGELRGYIKVTRNITEQKKAQDEIKQANGFLNTVLENLPNMVFVKDSKDLKFVMFNKAGEELLGISREELIGKNDHDLFPKEEADFFASKDRKTMQDGKLVDIPEEPIQTRHQGVRTLHTKKIPVLDAAGAPRFLMGISEDITEQKKQENLRVYARALEASNKDLQDFIFVASHDLQEPLRKIHAFGNFLDQEEKKSLSETGKDYLKRIRDASQRMSTLLSDLLDLTRITTRAKPFSRVDLNIIVQEVISDLEIRLEETGGKVETQELPVLDADPAQMRQLFQNLISNALKFHKPGEKPLIRISSEIDKAEEVCRLQVSDNGIGFDAKYAEKIFNIFQRLHGQGQYPGTGIGLAICRKVTERHGGKIQAQSQEGMGATFTITLPLRQAGVDSQPIEIEKVLD
jgi:two-component system sensor kinase FixL